jgi:putative transposase
MVNQLRSSNHCVYLIQFHLVLVTKYRRKCITGPMLERLKEIFDTLKRWDGLLVEFNGEPDHVHLLLELPPNVRPSGLINNMKTVSSRYLRRDFTSELERVYSKPVFWSRSYCLLSCGGAPLSVLRQYIENQAGAD